MRLFSVLLLACLLMPVAVQPAQSSLTLYTERSSPGDLEIGGELAGVSPGATRYLHYDELLKLPEETFTVTDDNFHTPAQISGISLNKLAQMLGQHADMIVAICDDAYRSNYSPDYLAVHDPILVMRINGQTREHWPKASDGDSMAPYVIANPFFKPAFKVLGHEDESQIPYGIARLEFRQGERVYAPILPRTPWRTNTVVMNGYRIAREDCFRCHNAGAEGGTKSGKSWNDLGKVAFMDPMRFRAIVHDPDSVLGAGKMPGQPAYDAATLDALTKYYSTFAPADSANTQVK